MIFILIDNTIFTEAFRTKDTDQRGVITIGFEEFLGVALDCSI